MRSPATIVLVAILLLTITTHFFGAEGVEPEDGDPPRQILNDDPVSNMTGLYGGIITYEDTALIVNDNSESSKEIGTYFAMRRGLPEENIINITAPTDEIVDFSEFDEMINEISDTLASRGLTDSIDYLVTTKGVPLKITSGYTNMNDQRYYYGASVDSELMLMDSQYESSIHRLWWIDNPYFDSDEPFSREKYGIRLVTRLTGYTVEEAKRLVDMAEPSLGVRGEAFLDMDPGKGIGNTGYGVGNKWMSDANDWLVENNWTVHLDNTNTFRTGMSNVSAYFSWGSNDGDWGENQMTNTGFESGNGAIPSGWTVESEGGTVERTTEQKASGSWSLKMTRNTTGVLRAYQDVTLNYPDHRFIADGRMRPSGVTSPGARILLKGFDSSGNQLWDHTLTNRTGTRNWYYIQDPLENVTGTTMIRYIVELLGEGSVYFDQNFMRVIRPHNQWVPGSIAETIVSTGGRSQNYGTWYGQSLIADIIRDGVTGIKGYAWEPFIGAISHADILFPAYYTGYNLAESFWMGSELASWMGYVVGDPKCTPYLNERADMGFAGEEPLSTYVDEEGIPHLSFTLHNKGKRMVENGSVELFVDNTSIWKGKASIDPDDNTTIEISSEDEPIIGTHIFRIELNNDGAIWEFDGKDNVLEKVMVVNSIPSLDLSVEVNEVNRTLPLNFTASVHDEDGNIGYEGLNLHIAGPAGREYLPEFISTEESGPDTEFRMRFVPPHNATTGFYTIRGRYDDPEGSFAEDTLYSSFRVINNAPVVSGEIFPEDVPRGGRFTVNITWFDRDTPDGDLDVNVFAARTLGREIEAISQNVTGETSATYLFEIPVEESSGSWSVTAEVLDRDGDNSRWKSIIRSFNRPPRIELIGKGHNVTRRDSFSFDVIYRDPEGHPSSLIYLRVFGPLGEGTGETILEKDLTLDDGETSTISVNPRNLATGPYGVSIEYEDDERAGEIFTFQPLFNVIPMAPVISEPVIGYDEGDGPPGGVFVRGESIRVSIPVTDFDSIGGGLDVKAFMTGPDSTTTEIYLDARSDGIYRVRINTDGTWDIGEYSLMITAVDEDGMNHSLEVPVLFRLTADHPVFEDGSINVNLNGTVECTVILGIFPSSSQPVDIEIYLFDGNDSLVGIVPLESSGGFGSYEGTGAISGQPVRGALLVEDDLGRTFWLNETMEFEYESEDDIDQEPVTGDEEGDDPLLLILMISLSLLIMLPALIFTVTFALKARRSRMMAPPPAAVRLPAGENENILPAGSGAPGLPSSGGAAIPPGAVEKLPPGRVIEDGDSSYHRPEKVSSNQREEDKAINSGGNEEDFRQVPLAPEPVKAHTGEGIQEPDDPQVPVMEENNQPDAAGKEAKPAQEP